MTGIFRFKPNLFQNNLFLSFTCSAVKGWNGYRHKSQQRKLTLETKIIPAAVCCQSHYLPVNMPHPIRERFLLRPAGSQNRAGPYNYDGSFFPYPIWFRFSREGLDRIVQKTRPGLCVCVCVCVCVWPNASCLEANWCARLVGPGSDRTQPARYQFPISDSP